jgi:hypothetical protein
MTFTAACDNLHIADVEVHGLHALASAAVLPVDEVVRVYDFHGSQPQKINSKIVYERLDKPKRLRVR